MDELNQTSVVTPEEQNAEKEMTIEVTDEQLRDKVVADFGLDPNTQQDLIDKLVVDKKATHEKLSGAIKQKISWRTKATSKPDDKGGDQNKDVASLVSEEMAKRDLENLQLPDEITSEIKDLAKSKGISIKEATQLPYIQFKISEVKKEERVITGTPVRINNGGKVMTIDPSKALNPADYALDTPEGQAAWNEAKKAKREYEKNH